MHLEENVKFSKIAPGVDLTLFQDQVELDENEQKDLKK